MVTKSDLDWIKKKIEEIDSRVEKFWKNPVWKDTPVLQVSSGRMYYDCRTSESSFNAQIESIKETLSTKTDWMPFLEPWHGTGVYAEAFGAKYFWKENDTPWTNFIINSLEEARKIKKPDWKKSEIMNLVLSSIRYFKKMAGDNIPISLTDTQSPLDNAMLMWETNSFIAACYDEPETVHWFLDLITELIIEFSLVQIKEIGQNIARPGHNAALTRPWGKTAGIGLSDDFLVTVSPKFYDEFGKRYNEKIADALGGVVIHSCGLWSRDMIAKVLETRGLMGVELAISEGGKSSLQYTLGDPNPNPPETIRDGFKETELPVKGRLGNDPEDVLGKIYHKDLIFIPQIMWEEDKRTRNKNYEGMHRKIEELAGI